MAKKEVKHEQINKEELVEEIILSERWLVINNTESNLNIRAKSPASLTLIAEFLNLDRDFFKMVCDYIKDFDEEEKAKLN